MSLHYQKELKHIDKIVRKLIGHVEQNFADMQTVLTHFDEELARKTIKHDKKIDKLEIEIQEECLKTLALYHPMGTDLRYIVMLLRVNRDLERLGDLISSICRRLILLNEQGYKYENLFAHFVENAKAIMISSFDVLYRLDSNLAYSVIEQASILAPEKKEQKELLVSSVKSSPEQLEIGLQLIGILRHIERVGDHAANIAKDVIYFGKGEIVRHSVVAENGQLLSGSGELG